MPVIKGHSRKLITEKQVAKIRAYIRMLKGKIDWDEEKAAITKEFFEKRFKRKAHEDDSYFQEWVDRFNGYSRGINPMYPEIKMDSESMRVFTNILKKKAGV